MLGDISKVGNFIDGITTPQKESGKAPIKQSPSKSGRVPISANELMDSAELPEWASKDASKMV